MSMTLAMVSLSMAWNSIPYAISNKSDSSNCISLPTVTMKKKNQKKSPPKWSVFVLEQLLLVGHSMFCYCWLTSQISFDDSDSHEWVKRRKE